MIFGGAWNWYRSTFSLAVTPSVAIFPLWHVNKRFLCIFQYCEASFVSQGTWIAVQKNNWVLGLGSELKLRIMTFSRYDSRPAPLPQELGWDGLSIRRIKLLATEIFKVYNNMATNLCQIFLKMRSTYDTRSSFSRFQLPLPKTNYDKQRFGLQFAKTGACRNDQWSEWTEKVSMVDSYIFIYDFCDWKPHRLQFVHLQLFKTLSNLEFLSQLTISHRGQWNSTTWSVMQ